jgi:hypothetical protein
VNGRKNESGVASTAQVSLLSVFESHPHTDVNPTITPSLRPHQRNGELFDWASNESGSLF